MIGKMIKIVFPIILDKNDGRISQNERISKYRKIISCKNSGFLRAIESSNLIRIEWETVLSINVYKEDTVSD